MRLMNRAGSQCPPRILLLIALLAVHFRCSVFLPLWANIVPIVFSYSAKEPEANAPLLAAIDLMGKHYTDVAFSHHLNTVEEEDTLTFSC